MYDFDFDPETNGSFMCLDCLAAFFHTDRGSLEAKIDAFRDDGCSLFE